MIEIVVEYVGLVRRPAGPSVQTATLPEEVTSRGLLTQLGYTAAEQRALRLSREGTLLAPGSKLYHGDRVALFLAVGGG